jgi:hypothetical protein
MYFIIYILSQLFVRLFASQTDDVHFCNFLYNLRYFFRALVIASVSIFLIFVLVIPQ